MNIDNTLPAKRSDTAPQAQLAVRSMIGRGFRSIINEGCTGNLLAARRLIQLIEEVTPAL
jgi:hypothetical protein